MLSIFDQGAPAPCPTPFNLAARVLARASDLPDKCALQVIRPAGNAKAAAESWSCARLAAAGVAQPDPLPCLPRGPNNKILRRALREFAPKEGI